MLFKSSGSGPLSSQGLGWTAGALTESHPVPSAHIPVAPEKWDLARHSALCLRPVDPRASLTLHS